MTDSVPPTSLPSPTTKRLRASETLKIDGPADVTIRSSKPPVDLNTASGQVEVKPYFAASETVTTILPAYAQKEAAGGQFTLASEEKPRFSPLSNEDRDITEKMTGGNQWEAGKPQISGAGKGGAAGETAPSQVKSGLSEKLTAIRDSPFFHEAQHKFEQTRAQIAGTAQSLRARGRAKLHELQQRGAAAAAGPQAGVRRRADADSYVKWSEALPYLLPALILTLAVLSGLGAYRAWTHRHAGPAVLAPILDGNADFTPNPMMQTPYHLHDDDAAVRREREGHAAGGHGAQGAAHAEGPSMMEKMKFKANLYAHHAHDTVWDGANAIKEGIEDIAGHTRMTVDNAVNYVNEKANFLKNKGAGAADAAKESIGAAKDRAGEAVDSIQEKTEIPAQQQPQPPHHHHHHPHMHAQPAQPVEQAVPVQAVPVEAVPIHQPPIHHVHHVVQDVPPHMHHVHGVPVV